MYNVNLVHMCRSIDVGLSVGPGPSCHTSLRYNSVSSSWHSGGLADTEYLADLHNLQCRSSKAYSTLFVGYIIVGSHIAEILTGRPIQCSCRVKEGVF